MNTPGGDERFLELKVGAMILVAVVLLVTFILILGDWSLKSQKEIEVFFQNPGGLTGGATVKVAGRTIGKITEITFLGRTGPRNPFTGLPALVRARVALDEDVYDALRKDVNFYVTTKGMLGDPFLEIDPGVSSTPMDSRKPVFGMDPPRLDLFMADTYQLIKGLNSLLDRNAESLDVIVQNGAKLMGAVAEAVDGGTSTGNQIDKILTGVEDLVGETRELVTAAKERYVDDPQVARILDNLESLSGKLNREVDPLLVEIRDALAAVDRLTGTIGPEDQRRIRESIAKLESVMTRADKTLIGVEDMVNRVRKGEGTVGQMMKDEEIYDDLKELIRDIKQHPWKIIWED